MKTLMVIDSFISTPREKAIGGLLDIRGNVLYKVGSSERNRGQIKAYQEGQDAIIEYVEDAIKLPSKFASESEKGLSKEDLEELKAKAAKHLVAYQEQIDKLEEGSFLSKTLTRLINLPKRGTTTEKLTLALFGLAGFKIVKEKSQQV